MIHTTYISLLKEIYYLIKSFYIFDNSLNNLQPLKERANSIIKILIHLLLVILNFR